MYFLLDGLKGFDDPAYSEIIVVFGAVESADDQVDNAEMVLVGLLFVLRHFCSLLLLDLQPLHNLLSFFVFVHHNITHAEICHHDSRQTEHVVCVFVYDRLIVSDCFVVSLEDEEDVSDVEFPGLVVCAELCALTEKFLDD